MMAEDYFEPSLWRRFADMVWRYAAGLAVTLLTLALFAACGSGSQPGGGQPTPDGPEGIAQATGEPLASPTGTARQVAGQGGLDPACVQAVLGRPATGFADITSAEQALIFSQCSPQGGTPAPGQFGRPIVTGAGLDLECAARVLERETFSFEDMPSLTEEERVKVFEECSDGEFQFRPIDGTPGPGGGPQFGVPGQGGGPAFGGPAAECIQRALGSAGDIRQLTPEQRSAVLQECGIQGGSFQFTPPQ
jgi:hypothetical protein